jgi:putative tricarboxylic transport membrane protein
MEPGPLIFIASSDLVSITILAMFLANLLIVLLGWLQTRLVTMLQHMRSANGG